jgi:hypothetical protein
MALEVGQVAQLVYLLATGWTVRGSNPGGVMIFSTCPDRPWGPPSLLYNGYRVFPGGKERPGRDDDPSPPFIAVVMKEYSPYEAVRPVQSLPECLYRGALYRYIFLKCWKNFGASCSMQSHITLSSACNPLSQVSYDHSSYI